MKIRNILLPVIFLLIGISSLSSQNTATLYFMKDIAERNEMNPAFTPNCKFYFDFIILPNIYMGVGTNDFAHSDFKSRNTTLHLTSGSKPMRLFLCLKTYSN